MPTESSITATICRNLKANGLWYMKITGGPMQKTGIPDLLTIVNGHAVFMEVKRPGNKPTKLQSHRMQELRDAGATVGVVTNWKEAKALLGV